MITHCHPKANTELSGLYVSNGIYCTQCEAEGFRRITYFYDRPDVMARYRVRIEGPLDIVARCCFRTAIPAPAGRFAGTDRHFAVWDDPLPKPSYLFALVAGDLAMVADHLYDAVGPQGGTAHLCREGQGGPLRLGDGVAQDLDALGRGAVRPRI